MEISLSGIPYQILRKSYPQIFPSLPEYFSSLSFKEIKSLILIYDKEFLEEIKVLNSYFSFKINVQVGTTAEQIHELLSISPTYTTLSNLQRKDNCIDLLLFKEQIQEILQNFPFKKENLYVKIEGDPEQIKVASKIGINQIEIEFPFPHKEEKEREKFEETMKIANKMDLKIAFGKGMDFENLKILLKKYKPQELIVDYPFYNISFKYGIEEGIKYLNYLKKEL